MNTKITRSIVIGALTAVLSCSLTPSESDDLVAQANNRNSGCQRTCRFNGETPVCPNIEVAPQVTCQQTRAPLHKYVDASNATLSERECIELASLEERDNPGCFTFSYDASPIAPLQTDPEYGCAVVFDGKDVLVPYLDNIISPQSLYVPVHMFFKINRSYYGCSIYGDVAIPRWRPCMQILDDKCLFVLTPVG